MQQISKFEELKDQLQNEKWELEFKVIDYQNNVFNQGAKLKKFEKRISKLKNQLGITEIDNDKFQDGFDTFQKSDCNFFESAQNFMKLR